MNQPIEELEEKKVAKSRHLPILDFYQTLQIEFIQADLRTKIYPKLKDKHYWGEKVREGKRATIEKLATRNNLPSIFTDESMLRDFEKKVYRDVSYPLFTYRDQNHQLEQSYYDLKYYYNLGSDVRVNLFEDVKTGKITKEYVPFRDNYVYVTIDGIEDKYSINIVTRIL